MFHRENVCMFHRENVFIDANIFKDANIKCMDEHDHCKVACLSSLLHNHYENMPM